MATIRIVMTACAALGAVAWSMHAPAQAQTGAPLNIIETAKSEGKPAQVRTKKAAATKKVSSRKVASSKSKNASKNARIAGDAKKARVARAETPRRVAGQRPKASPISAEPDHPFATSVEPDPALTSSFAATSPIALAATSRAAPKPRAAFAQASEGRVMGGADSVSLIARLPWWRNDNNMQTIRYGGPQAQSQVMAAAEAWLANSDTSDDSFDNIVGNERMRFDMADPSGARIGGLRKGDLLSVADAAEFNHIDAAASEVSEASPEPPPVDRTLLHSILAILGGALAAAASARYLFV